MSGGANGIYCIIKGSCVFRDAARCWGLWQVNRIANPEVYQGEGKGTLGISGHSHFYLKAGTPVLAGSRLPFKGLPGHSSCS